MPLPVPKAPAPAPGNKTPLLLGALLILLGGGGYVGYTRFAQKPAASGSKPAPIEVDPGVVALDPFVLNLADAAGDRYFRLSVRIVLDQKSAAVRAGSGLPEVKLRDRVLTVLSKKRASQLATVQGKEALRAEIQAAVGELIADPSFFAGAGPSGSEGGAGSGGESEGASRTGAEGASSGNGATVQVMEVFFTEFLVQ